jgi:hypothetical protein
MNVNTVATVMALIFATVFLFSAAVIGINTEYTALTVINVVLGIFCTIIAFIGDEEDDT